MKAFALSLVFATFIGCGGATTPTSEEAVPASAPATRRALFVCADRPELAPVIACLEERCSTSGRLVDDGEDCMLASCEQELDALEVASGACYWCAIVELLNGTTFDDAIVFCGGQP